MPGMNSAPTLQATPSAVAVTVTDDTLSVDLADGRTIAVPIGWYPRLAYGTPRNGRMSRLLGLVTGCIGLTWTKISG